MSKFWTTVGIIAVLFVGTVIYKKKFAPKRKINYARLEEVAVDPTSGIKYEIIKKAPADAKKATKGETVVVHYTGWLNNNGNRGDRFDSSYDREKPFEFVVGAGQVIKGWDAMLEQMAAGERRIVYIPADLAYGQVGVPGVIPAGADLIFDIELIDIK